MREYVIAILGASMLSAVASLSSYRQGEKITALALSVITAAAVLLPLGKIVEELPTLDADFSVAELPDEREYEEVAMNAYLDGVRDAVADRFSIDEDDLRVFCVGFDFEKMRCECLTVRVQGGAVFSDFDAIKKYLCENLGGCEVEIIIG